jgi:hypothetical protein
VKKIFAALLILFFVWPVGGQSIPHILVRRISVFPMQTPEDFANKADEVWWELRSFLTKDKRFLVAAKNFLMQQNVFQSRGALNPDGAIILGRLLDADAVMTSWLTERTLHMAVYETQYGRPLWIQELPLQPSLPVVDQLSSGSLKLARDFLASIPYQGFVVVDPLKGQALFRDGKRLLVKADVGLSSEVEVGDPVELLHVSSDHIKPLFTHGATVEVFAQGRVVALERDVITVELSRLTRATDIEEKTLVRLPREQKRLQQLYAIADPLKNKISPEFLSSELSSAKQTVAENKPLIASLAFIINLTAFLFLAF